ncbi:MAG: prephenate dehydrogenase/arogenate dehydrogenase family protein [Polyangiaceae bacterium]|nr:prephenate dehydrogenase/arogenate dehydrogenase family protein [Polyangiaceae bacterium]
MTTVGVLGYGRFGSALCRLLADAGMAVRAYDPAARVPSEHAVASFEALSRGADFVAMAVPVPEMHAALAALRPHVSASQIVFDVGSVKLQPVEAMSEVLGAAVPWCGTHPLFGPVSLALAERPLRVVLCPAPGHAHAAARVRALYEQIGCDVIEQSAESHDRVMAYTHALTFFVAKGMMDAGAGAEVPFAPPSFQAISRTIETVRSDAGHLFAAIARDNPFASDARKHLVAALGEIDRALDAQVEGTQSAREPGGADAARFAIPDLGARSPELRQTREHIDSVDREIVRLLAQRAQLQQGAAQAKAALGAPVLDAAREAEMLAARRAWAAEGRLDPDGVADVFHAVLRMSRRSQRP